MRKVLIVGAGQAGLQLALGLQAEQYEVTLVSGRTPEQIRGGRVMSTQAMFGTALAAERARGLNFWDGEAPPITGLRKVVEKPGEGRLLDWRGRFSRPAQSVDQRVKMARWLELFAERGGAVEYRDITASELDEMAARHDLAVVATGAGELGRIFERDARHSPFTAPQRALAVAYVRGAAPSPDEPDAGLLRATSIPGVGDIYVIPGCTFGGACDVLLYEGIPGGPMDCWSDRPGGGEQWARMLELMREHLPWEHARFAGAELTDERATLTGGVTPVVRKPVAELPSGAVVLGMGDAVVANDPITGQGANVASRCAESYLDSIVARGAQEFDRSWMQRSFEEFWRHARHVVSWTNTSLRPAQPHVQRLVAAAARHPEIRDRFADGFDDPADFQTWLLDPEGAEEYLRSFG
ncbi:FAD-binding oxidoreductase [Saccharopolyspora indica]|uniref:styrene monooxygenase/indole monooxygenase family protein n=1 Tax=Saccharopolyspora indica TaxID=1229659 RepID=UPI0022EAF55F|nr:styrene monooxygenase/indole monooxygenase family protein [Saccharopolyspora indica]MDA3647591.1 FAD-binding oxidoreductase [Saccharopolyspora indica]